MMSTTQVETEKLSRLPDHTRVWIYQSNRELSSTEVEQIENSAKDFLTEWNAHGAKMSAQLVVLYNRFVVLAADETAVQASGCSIDSSVRFLKTLEQNLNIDLFDRLNLAFRDASGNIATKTVSEFQEAIDRGEITPATIVFNNLVNTLGDLRKSWEVPASGSWHVRMLN